MEYKDDLLDEVTNTLCVFLRIDRPKLTSTTIEDRVREVVVAKLCELINIRCAYNYKNDTFYFFSVLVGDVLMNKMGYDVSIAPAVLKLFKYNGINLVEEVDRLITTLPLNEALIECFNLLDDLKDNVDNLKIRKYVI